MDPEHIPIIINAGIGGVLLWLYVRQSAQVAELQRQLEVVRQEQWQLIVTLVGQEAADDLKLRSAISSGPLNYTK
jgi:hypothetical protein